LSELNEKNLIVSLESMDQILHLSKCKVKADDFVFHKDALSFVLDYFKKYRNTPSSQILIQQFPDFSDVKPDKDSLDFYIDELKRDASARRISVLLEKEIPKIATDPIDVAKKLYRELNKLVTESDSDVSHTDRDAIQRLDEYNRKTKEHDGFRIVGVPTGLDYFNRKGEGFPYGALVTVAGQSYAGKSWLLLYMAVRAYLGGNRVLLISCEMTKIEEELRFDVLMGNVKRYKLPFSLIRMGRGNLSEEYEKYLTDLSQTDNWITADASDLDNFEMDDIVAMTDKFKPDVVVIDGMEFLQDSKSRNRQGWEEKASVIRRAKTLATSRNVLVMCTAQSKMKGSSEDRMPKMADVSYATDIVRAADYVITLAMDGEDEGDLEDGHSIYRRYSIQKERNARGMRKGMKLLFDVENGEIGEIHE